jgi:hypothetical protein
MPPVDAVTPENLPLSGRVICGNVRCNITHGPLLCVCRIVHPPEIVCSAHLDTILPTIAYSPIPRGRIVQIDWSLFARFWLGSDKELPGRLAGFGWTGAMTCIQHIIHLAYQLTEVEPIKPQTNECI